VRPDELHTAFNFDFLRAPWDAGALRDVIDTSIEIHAGVGAAPSWVLSNHDVVRHVTRYGGGRRGERRARAAALLMLALPGGAYVYQGEELGLPEVLDLPDEVRQDPTFFRTGGAELGRDGCRVPIPWIAEAPSFGFGPGPTPWLPQPPAWRRLAADRQEADAESMLNLYRRALALRRKVVPRDEQAFEWVDAGRRVLAFRRGEFGCVVNVGDRAAAVPPPWLDPGNVLLASGPLTAADSVPGATAIWLRSV
jgi:alpha-glucosidase